MRSLAILIISVFLFNSCEKEKSITQPDKIDFNGITQRAADGFALSVDSTDWSWVDDWTNPEQALFAGPTASCLTTNPGYSISAYPNPCNDILNFKLVKPVSYRVMLRIVDKQYNLIASVDSISTSSFALNMETLNVPKDTVRIYYKIVGSEGEYRGHGDVVRSKN